MSAPMRLLLGAALVYIFVMLLMTAYSYGGAAAYSDCAGMFDHARLARSVQS